MNSIYYVYQLRRADSEEPLYIGTGHGRRAYDHFEEARKWDGKPGKAINAFKLRSILKSWEEGVTVEVEFLFTDLTQDEGFEREVWAIDMWGRRDRGLGPLTNLTDGGDGVRGYEITPERSKQISEQLLGNKHAKGRKKTPEEIEQIRIRMIGNQHTRGRVADASERMARSRNASIRMTDPEARSKQISYVDKINSQPIVCEHCGKESNKGNYKQFHGDNCKLSPNYNPENRKRKPRKAIQP